MDKDTLKQLAANKSLHLEGIRQSNPDLAAAIEGERRREVKAALARAAGRGSPAIAAAVAEIDTADLSGPDGKAAIKEALARAEAPASVKAEMAGRLLAAASDRRPGAEYTDLPIGADPALRPLVAKGEIIAFAEAAGLGSDKVDALSGAIADVTDIDDAVLDTLSKAGSLGDADVRVLALRANLNNLADGETGLAHALAGARFNSIGGPLGEIKDLLRVPAKEIEAAIVAAGAVAEGGPAAASLAAELKQKAADVYPAEAIRIGLGKVSAIAIAADLALVSTLAAADARLFDKDTASVRIEGSPQQREAIAAAHRKLVAVARRHPGLGIDGMLAKGGSPADVATAVAVRIAAYDRFLDDNAGTELMALDLSAESADLRALKLEAVPAADRSAVIANLKAQQRVFAIADDADTTVKLLEAGFTSALGIARIRPQALAARSAIPLEEAQLMHERAAAAMAGISAIVGSMIDAKAGSEIGPGGAMVGEEVVDSLRGLDGYEQLFGPVASCDCAHCSSILSPAAYFVDLMRFIEEHVLEPSFPGAKQGHPLNLAVRRPDLWTCDLSCESTNTLMPTLEIINEIIENYIARTHTPAIDIANRVAVRALVYDTVLAEQGQSFNLPFALGAAIADGHLGLLDTSREEIVRTLGRGGTPAEVQAALKISRRQYDIIVTSNTDRTYLQGLYSRAVTINASGGVSRPETRDLMTPMGLSRKQLAELADTDFVNGGAARTVRLVSGKRDPASVQNDIEHVEGLTVAVLDRMNRLARLSRLLPWSIKEIDLVLAARTGASPPSLDAAALGDLVWLWRTADRFAMTAEELCGLWTGIPTRETAPGRTSMQARLFNAPPFAQSGTALPDASLVFLHPAFRIASSASTGSDLLGRLLHATQMSDAELAELLRLLGSHIGIDPDAASEASRSMVLSASNLTLLWRHARLAGMLRRRPAELAELIVRSGTPAGVIASLAELKRLLAYEAWLAASTYALAEIAFITGESSRIAAHDFDAARLAREIVDGIVADGVLEFSSTVFAFVGGITEQQSRAIVAANAALLDSRPMQRLRIKDTIRKGETLSTPAGLSASATELAATLARHHPANVLPPRLARGLELSTSKLEALIAVSGIELDRTGIAQALYGGDRTALEADIRTLGRLAALFKSPAFSPDRLAFVAGHRAMFALPAPAAPAVAALRNVEGYRRLLERGDGTADAAAIDSALVGFTSAQKFGAVPAATMARALEVSEAEVASLLAAVDLPGDAVEAMATLAGAAALSRRSGLAFASLQKLSSTDPTEVRVGADAIAAALKLRHTNPSDLARIVEPQDDRLRSLKRDALAAEMIRGSSGRFKSFDDLYAYLCVEVEMQGCARTTRVAAAISSAQTYVHRIILDLERDSRPPGDPQHVRLLPSLIPEDEWGWRKNYRTWEANRKVFLWPENYLEPELRDDKTPLFRELEERLLQQDINEQNALDAYAAYSSGLEELASLKIAGAYHEMHPESRTDILHVFGCTTDDPPTYYYWTVTNAHFSRLDADRLVTYSARRRLTLSIPVRTVAPVVHLGRLFLFWTQITTAPRTTFQDGSARFDGYRHTYGLRFSYLRLDSSWTPPQQVDVDAATIFSTGGKVADVLAAGIPIFDRDENPHVEAKEGYTLGGFQWERVYPVPLGDSLVIGGANMTMQHELDAFDRKLRDLDDETRGWILASWPWSQTHLHVTRRHLGRQLFETNVSSTELFLYNSPDGIQAIVADGGEFEAFYKGSNVPQTPAQFRAGFGLDALGPAIAWVTDRNATVQAVPGAPGASGIILQGGADCMYVFPRPHGRIRYRGLRLSSTLAGEISRTLFVGGIVELLALSTQTRLAEAEHLIAPISGVDVEGPVGGVDFKGPLGVYFRELFFHIPELIASQLNTRRKHRASQLWRHYYFDPTASAESDPIVLNPTPAELRQVQRDRVWRYLEFRGLTPPRLRDILTDEQAIEAYRRDPFNPHAIARLRISAYQKSGWMKYVTNLIDWGDSLFAQFTRESIDEALVLYHMAKELLGRPAPDVGPCGTAVSGSFNYANIRPWLEGGSEILPEIETAVWVGPRAKRNARLGPGKAKVVVAKGAVSGSKVMRLAAKSAKARMAGASHATGKSPAAEAKPHRTIRDAVKSHASAGSSSRRSASRAVSGAASAQKIAETARSAPSRQMDWSRTRIETWVGEKSGKAFTSANDRPLIGDAGRVAHFGWSIVRQLGPVFCVPENKELRALWQRVDDRLHKIRHCLDLNGVRRDLAPFAPEIDPRLLVRGKAEGLSLEDMLGPASGDLPPYRFTYLIEKAKGHVAAAQAFGSQLLAALERRDVEALSKLRNDQQMNMMRLTSRLRDWDVRMAEDAVEQLERQKTAIEFRRDYYEGLNETDLLPWERTQQVSRHAATATLIAGAALKGTAGVLSLIPEVGAPTAMKYGGQALGGSSDAWGSCLRDTGQVAEVLSASAGLEASFERRREGWSHQVDLAEHELKQIEKQLTAARLRLSAATRAAELHERAITDHEEVMELFSEKFSSLGRLRLLSNSLQATYRQALHSAVSMARLAERAYRFERSDPTTPLLEGNYWDVETGGLNGADRAMADLLDMERRFIETGYRTLEIDQPFSLMQLAPDQLYRLRRTGECEFALPELAFDIFYPGHYARRIRAVRLSIPCVTGPYVNVAATLTLISSRMRAAPVAGAAGLVEVPLRHSVSIASSTAQADAGVFDFSFRDERYMPFEGAGAVSTWRLSLPSNFRPFDYTTITDVILQISYTALPDGALRSTVQSANAALEGSVGKTLATQPMQRAISLRQDFSPEFHRLVSNVLNTEVGVAIDERWLPIFVRGLNLRTSRARLLLRVGGAAVAAGTRIRINGHVVSTFGTDPALPGMRIADVAAAFPSGLLGRHVIAIENAGDVAPVGVSGPATCDLAKLSDIVLLFETLTG